MSSNLVTFSGKFGDILWSLPTAKAISSIVGDRVDFAMMPPYANLIPLLSAQSYIRKAFVIEDWHCIHSNHGDQPWNPPTYIDREYSRSWHLGYRGHPGINAEAMPLIEFIAYQQGLSFQGVLHKPVPFLDLMVDPSHLKQETFEIVSQALLGSRRYISYAFNAMYIAEKQQFLNKTKAASGMEWVDIARFPWLDAAALISASVGFIGCRSANYVLAHGVGKRMFIFEPHPARNEYGHLGKIFGCPYGDEVGSPHTLSIQQAVNLALDQIELWKKEQENEQIATAGTR